MPSKHTPAFNLFAIAAIAVTGATATAPADDWNQQAKLLADDGAQGDEFGVSVSLSDDAALVGAYYDDDHGTQSGSAYVFRKVGGVWVQEAKLLATDGAPDDHFGRSVSLSADRALVGAPYDDDHGGASGSAYVFRKVRAVWAQTAKLTADDAAPGDQFGASVCLRGDTALVGASADDDNGTNSGSAHVFRFDGANWVQEAKLLAGDGAADDYFGRSVSLCGDTVLVGAWHDDDYGTDSGSAYVFRKVGAVWVQEAKLLPNDGAPGDYFGWSVSLFADTALVGAYRDDDHGTNSGSAYVFHKVGGVWVQETKLLASDAAPSDQFGRSVSLSGDRALVAACGDDDNGYGSGSAYVFRKVAGVWVQEAKLLASDGAADDWFGGHVSLSADTALVGVRGDDDDGSNSGSAYLFVPPCPGDIDADGDTDNSDLGALLSAWESEPGDPHWNPDADLDSDGQVGHSDLGILLADWGCGT